VIIPDDLYARHSENVPLVLAKALSQRPGWRDYSPHQLSVLMFLYGYTTVPANKHDTANALTIALTNPEPDRGAA
jgi:hypothetical protein